MSVVVPNINFGALYGVVFTVLYLLVLYIVFCLAIEINKQCYSLRQLMCPHPREFAHFFKKMLMPGGWPGKGGTMGTAGIE